MVSACVPTGEIAPSPRVCAATTARTPRRLTLACHCAPAFSPEISMDFRGAWAAWGMHLQTGVEIVQDSERSLAPVALRPAGASVDRAAHGPAQPVPRAPA